jgi:hypothetical protein
MEPEVDRLRALSSEKPKAKRLKAGKCLKDACRDRAGDRLGQAHGERAAVRDRRRSPRVPGQSVVSGVRLNFVSVVMTS